MKLEITVTKQELITLLSDRFPGLTSVKIVQPRLSAETKASIKVEHILGLIKSGHRIGAIKEIRAVTGISLKEAKDILDGMSDGICQAADHNRRMFAEHGFSFYGLKEVQP